MDVDEKDEYEMISEMQKPANFSSQRDVENEEPEMGGINMHTQGNAAGAEVKRLSRWDVGAPFCIQLNDALALDSNEAVVKKCTGLDEMHKGASNKTINENEKGKFFTNKLSALKIVSSEMERCVKSAEVSTASEYGQSQSGSCVDFSLNEIALPSDPCGIVLPAEPSGLCEDAGCALLSSTVDKLDSDSMLDKGKVVMKWKFMKTSKELPTVDVKIWEPEVTARELPRFYSDEEQAKSILLCAETSVDPRTVTDNLNSYICRSPLPNESLLEQSTNFGEAVVSSCIPGPNASVQSQDNSDYVIREMQFLKNQDLNQKMTWEKVADGYSASNETLESDCSVASETKLSHLNLQYNLDLGTNLAVLIDEIADKKADVQAEELHLKDAKLPSEPMSVLEQEWRMDNPKTGVSGGKQESLLSTASTAAPVSVYSFNVTNSVVPSDFEVLQIDNERKHSPGTVDTVSVRGNATDLEKNEPLLRKTTVALDDNEGQLDISVASQPPQYEDLDENIVLCDENLIKEAKVCRICISFR